MTVAAGKEGIVINRDSDRIEFWYGGQLLGYFDTNGIDITTLLVGGTALTATADELNTLDTFTGDVNDFNKLASVTATAAELNYTDVSAAGTPEASKALIMDANNQCLGVVLVKTVDVDVSAGGTAQTTNILVLPANGVVLDVHVRCTEDFDGDTTQNFDVGVSGTADKYIASADFETGANDINSGDEAFSGSLGTPTSPVSVPAGETIIATWTNATPAVGTGNVRVSVRYYIENPE